MERWVLVPIVGDAEGGEDVFDKLEGCFVGWDEMGGGLEGGVLWVVLDGGFVGFGTASYQLGC